eukprot:gnl/TRDRNA2_/TRDRNA2_83826_c0_seq1.p1 gnl/TRDRNA2_/TRDRNA2_83826_c0~~gnl/TRDRNA2_/TRDRNA2_83826_c0_seq1.p1  ORF type:complete len:257 (+),score=53.19 gnl/TRDRNA2_/TRDRNA2_83826_c0_seq1:83-853(+)
MISNSAGCDTCFAGWERLLSNNGSRTNSAGAGEKCNDAVVSVKPVRWDATENAGVDASSVSTVVEVRPVAAKDDAEKDCPGSAPVAAAHPHADASPSVEMLTGHCGGLSPSELAMFSHISMAEDKSDAGGDPKRRLLEAARVGDINGALVALESGADAAQGAGKESPLHVAVRANNTVVMALLVSQKACLESQNHAGDSPLMVGIREGSWAALQWLVDSRADVNTVDKKGRSALSVARMVKRQHFADFLLAHGAAQ